MKRGLRYRSLVPTDRNVKFKILWALAMITRRFPLRGSERILRLIYDPFRQQANPWRFVMAYDDEMLIHVDTSSYLEWLILFYGYDERAVASVIKGLLKPGDVAFDVGANIGSLTLIMSSCAGPEGKVVAIEPHPKVFARLASNLQLNNIINVRAMACALSDREGTATLHSFTEGYANQGMASLHPLPGYGFTEEIAVECRTLDEVVRNEGLTRLDLIKIDTEGHEANVLKGASEALARFSPQVIMEYHREAWRKAGHDFNGVRDSLSRLGYRLYLIRRNGSLLPLKGVPPSYTNLLAMPNRHDQTVAEGSGP